MILYDHWQRGSYADDRGHVEVKRNDVTHHIMVRHSENNMWHMALTEAEWRNFITGIKAGEFDL